MATVTPPIAYLHGFASSPQSRKGVWLREALAAEGLHVELPDLNVPSFAALTASGALTAVDAMDAARRAENPAAPPWLLVGSSMGGYLAALWAARNPTRVRTLVLLCPGFDMARRWAALLGDEAMATWERAGALPFPDAAGQSTPLHWGFVNDGRALPPKPAPPCPTVIVHGRRDEQVPIDSSRAMAAEHAQIRLIEVDDDHGLMASKGDILAAVHQMLAVYRAAD